MRKIFLLILLIASYASFAQTSGTKDSLFYTGSRSATWWHAGQFNILNLPKVQPTKGRDSGSIFYKLSDSSIYVWSGSQWRKVGGGSVPTLQQVTNAGAFTTVDSFGITNRVILRNAGGFVGNVILRADPLISAGTLTLSNTGLVYRDGSNQTNVSFTTPTNGINFISIPDTSATLTTGVRVNNSTFMAGSNGVVNIGSVLTSTPTLQQVTAAGNSTTDSINVISGNGDRVVSLYKENTGSDVGRLFIGAQSSTTRIILSNSGINFSNGTHESSLRFATLGQNNTLDFPDTSGNLSVGVKLNGTTYMAGSNGIADIPYDTVSLAVFGAGAGLSTDTAAFQTTSIYGSFYHDGTDTLIITQMRIGLQGTSPSITAEVYWNDSLNVTAGATILVSGGTNATNTATGTNVTSFTNTKIPPGNWVWVRTSAVTTKPTYFSLTLIGYRKRK